MVQRGLVPGAITPGTLIRDGGIVPWPSTSLGSLVAAVFLHVSILHIGIKMMSLYFVGRYVEYDISRWEYAIAYLALGIAGNLTTAFLGPSDVVSVGASGAIFGLAGLLIVLWSRRRTIGARSEKTWLIMMLALNLVYDLATPGIAITAHVGGLGAGLLWGVGHEWATHQRTRRKLARWRNSEVKNPNVSPPDVGNVERTLHSGARDSSPGQSRVWRLLGTVLLSALFVTTIFVLLGGTFPALPRL